MKLRLMECVGSLKEMKREAIANEKNGGKVNYDYDEKIVINMKMVRFLKMKINNIQHTIKTQIVIELI